MLYNTVHSVKFQLQGTETSVCPETHYQCPPNGYCLPVFCIIISSYALHRSLSVYRWYHINTVVTIVFSLYDPETCPQTHYQCPPNGYCLPVFTRCNGHPDCPGQEDESDCDSYVCGGLYRCLGSRACLHPDYVCDGGTQCPR